MNIIRTIVSGEKKRYIDENFNLDLSYVTPRIIAMAFPGTGITSIYRNKLNDVADFLNQKHPNNYLILNLSGYKYEIEKFNKVIDRDDWLDHHSPPFEIIFELIKIIHDYLSENKEHIIVINCNAGKGRTGTLICCYLLFSGRFNDVNDAFAYYSLKRFNKGLGVSNPSQKRYVNYFFFFIKKEINITFPYVRKIIGITLSCIPYEEINSYIPSYNIYERNVKIKEYIGNTSYLVQGNKEIIFNKIPIDQIVKGDILIELFHKYTFKMKKLGRVAFNTAFIQKDDDKITFGKKEIDPYRFSQKTRIPDNYSITILFKKLDNCDCNNIKGQEKICSKCKVFLDSKTDNIISKYKELEKVINLYENNFEKGKILLFGDNEDDVEEILKDKAIIKVNPNLTRTNNSEIRESCRIF